MSDPDLIQSNENQWFE